MSRDPQVDDYIARQQDFAQPILAHVRARFHAALPGVEEGIRWGMPAFLHKGRLLANLAAFKAHAVLAFRRGEEVTDGKTSSEAMGQFGRMTSRDDLPADAILDAMIRKAAELAETGPVPRPARAPRPEAEVPDDLAAALAARGGEAEACFSRFSPSQRRDYVEWVVEAKRPETRAKRIEQAVSWIAEGKARHWKYEKSR